MSALSFFLIFAALITFVAGQLFLKRAMETTATRGFLHRKFVCAFTIGILSMTISFFLTLGLLRHFDLSYLYPFQGLSVIFISVAAAFLLREKLTAQLILGSLLITAGVVLVSIS